MTDPRPRSTWARVSRLIPALAWLLVILALTLLPPSSLPGPRIAGLDKVAHGLEFLVLAGLFTWGLSGPTRLFLRALVAAPIMALLAGLTEVLQTWVPGRSPEVGDLVADLAGILVGVAVTVMVMAVSKRSSVAG